MASVRPILVLPLASWMWPCNERAGCPSSIASLTAVEPTGTMERPPCLGRRSSVSSGRRPGPCRTAGSGNCRWSSRRRGDLRGHLLEPLGQVVLVLFL